MQPQPTPSLDWYGIWQRLPRQMILWPAGTATTPTATSD